MSEIEQDNICICMDLDNNGIRKYFNDILKKIDNSKNDKMFANMLSRNYKNLKNIKSEEWVNMLEYIITNLQEDNIYVLNKNSLEDVDTILVLSLMDCDNRINLEIELLTSKIHLGKEDFELGLKPLNILAEGIKKNIIEMTCCIEYVVSKCENLLIFPYNLSINPATKFLELGNFRITGYILEFENPKSSITNLEVSKGEDNDTIIIKLVTQYNNEFSNEILQKFSNKNLDYLLSLLG